MESVEVWAGLTPRQADWAVTSESLPEQIAQRIEALIAAGAPIRPGTRLPSERELAQIFGVSRLSVREAVHRLEALDLVVVRRGAGTFVARKRATPPSEPPTTPFATSTSVGELFDVRRLLEPPAARWAALRANRQSLAPLQRLAAQFEEAAAATPPRFEQLLIFDVGLHVEIARCAENMLLSRLLERLYDLDRPELHYSLRRSERMADTAVEHRRIVDAIAAHDGQGAGDAMLAHLRAAEDSMRAVVSGTSDPVD